MLRFFVFIMVLAPCIYSENELREVMPGLIKEYRVLKSETPDVKGKLDHLVEKLKSVKPDEADEQFETYLMALGELQLANGEYQEAAVTLKQSQGATVQYDWGVWKKIIEAVYRGEGKEAAEKEYAAVVEKIGDKPMGRDFIEMVGSHLEELAKVQ
jgi:predicted negative regulator of RcsB-dependent stress response